MEPGSTWWGTADSTGFSKGHKSPPFISHLMRPLASKVCFQRLMSFAFCSVERSVFHTQPQCVRLDIEKDVSLLCQTRSQHSSEYFNTKQYLRLVTRVSFPTYSAGLEEHDKAYCVGLVTNRVAARPSLIRDVASIDQTSLWPVVW